MKRALCSGLLLVGCAPTFADDSALVREARVLAVKSEPAEAAPGATLTWTALVATPSQSEAPPAPSWSLCNAPKPPTENAVVSSACLSAAALLPLGQGITIQGQIPFDSCSLFGPDTPPGGFRPPDPDITGGYYQPVRVDLLHAPPTFHEQRVRCALGQASADIASQFGMAYVPNQNPHLFGLSARSHGEDLGLDRIPAGAQLELEASWSAADAETYAYFDRTTQAVLMQREALSVAWYVDAGKLELESSGRADTDPALTANNTFTAPSVPGTSTLWLVLRDSRGGVDFARYLVTVLP